MSKRFLASKITDSIGLHSESILGAPVLELCGDDRVLVENVRKVISFDADEVAVAVSFGCIRIMGHGLIFDYLGADRILIIGTIMQICVERTGGST